MQAKELIKKILKPAVSLVKRQLDTEDARRQINFLKATSELLRLPRNSNVVYRDSLLLNWSRLADEIAGKDRAHARVLVDDAVAKASPGTPFRTLAIDKQRELLL